MSVEKIYVVSISSHDFSVSGKLQFFLLNGYPVNDKVLGDSEDNFDWKLEID
jgi:hypothetical protein